MLRVVLLFEYPTLNGGERSMLAALDVLTAGAALHVEALGPAEGPLAEALQARGIAVHPFECRDGAGKRIERPKLVQRLVDSVEQLRPDLLHANSVAMGRLTGAAAERLAIPTTAHLRDIIGLSGAAVADLNRNRRLVAVSEATRAFHCVQRIGSPENNGPPIDVLHNGVDLVTFRPRAATGLLRKELDVDDDAFLIGTIGQVALRKGHDVLAEAATLAATQTEQSLHFVLIGDRHSSKAESIAFDRAITETFARAGLAERLHRLGVRNDVSQLLNELDLLVHPARQEPLGRVLLEAAASGTAIIATRVGGTEEILEHGVSAQLVVPNDPAPLAAAILELTANPALRSRLATAARRRAEEKFDLRQRAPELADFWRHVASK